MCLYTEQYKPLVAKSDIECYKILKIIKDLNGNEIYITPYQFKKVEEACLSGAELFTPDSFNYKEFSDRLINLHKDYVRTDVNNGFIHTFTELSLKNMMAEMYYHAIYIKYFEYFIDCDIAETLNCETHPKVTGIALYKCVIPKGTEYFEGRCVGHGEELMVDSYAAKAIRYVEKITEIHDRESLNEALLKY